MLTIEVCSFASRYIAFDKPKPRKWFVLVYTPRKLEFVINKSFFDIQDSNTLDKVIALLQRMSLCWLQESFLFSSRECVHATQVWSSKSGVQRGSFFVLRRLPLPASEVENSSTLASDKRSIQKLCWKLFWKDHSGICQGLTRTISWPRLSTSFQRFTVLRSKTRSLFPKKRL